jgi:hypothetical protein
MSVKRFLIIITSLSLVTILVASLLIYRFFSSEIASSFIGGSFLAFLNVFAALVGADWSIRKPQKEFLKTFLGGTFIRLSLVGLLIFIGLKFLEFHPAGFLVSFFVVFFVFQFVEISFLNRWRRFKTEASIKN